MINLILENMICSFLILRRFWISEIHTKVSTLVIGKIMIPSWSVAGVSVKWMNTALSSVHFRVGQAWQKENLTEEHWGKLLSSNIRLYLWLPMFLHVWNIFLYARHQSNYFRVFPLLKESTAFVLMRPLLKDIEKNELPGYQKGKLFFLDPVIHSRIYDSMISIPKVYPGDTVWWHPDLVHRYF